MADLISSELPTSVHGLSPSAQFAAVSCSSNPASQHNGAQINSHNDISMRRSYSPSNTYLPVVSLVSCQREPLSSPQESKPVVLSGSDANLCSENLSQSSTPAIMSLAIGSENDFNADTAGDEDSLKGQSEYAWISKEKKSTRKQHQGLYCSQGSRFDGCTNWLINWRTTTLQHCFPCASHSLKRDSLRACKLLLRARTRLSSSVATTRCGILFIYSKQHIGRLWCG